MARGTQFRELINMLRSETGDSLDRATNINRVDAQKSALNNTYEWLYDTYDWTFLNIKRDEELQPGERYYSFDPDLNYEQVDSVTVQFGNEWYPVSFGIKPEHYNLINEGQRNDPVRRWAPYEDNQYEVWPTPAQKRVLRMRGVRKFKRLVDEKDVCLLDDLLVVFYTAARAAAKAGSKDAQLKLDTAMSRMRTLKGKVAGAKRRPFVLGGGSTMTETRLRPGIDYIPDPG